MNINLLEVLKDQFNSEVIVSLSEYVGEHSSDAFSGLNLVIPIVLGSIIKKASTNEGLDDLMQILEDNNLTEDLHTNLYNIIKNKDELSLNLEKGKQIVPKLFGSDLDSISEIVSEETGIREDTAKLFLYLVSLELINLIKTRNARMGWGKSGLAIWLMNQAAHVNNELKPGVAEKLGFDDLGDFLGKADKDNPKGTSEIIKMLIPWILGLVALLAALFYLRTCSKQDTKASYINFVDSLNTKVTDSSKLVLNETVGVNNNKDSFVLKKLPNGTELKLPISGIENKLLRFIEDPTRGVDKDTWYEFDRLYFKEASAELAPGSQEQLDNISAILKAYPKLMIKIAGYTDNTGDKESNLNLSTARAAAAMNAIIKMGVEARRISAEGFGDQYPIADNTTEKGREKNRRIAIRVKEK